MKTDVDARRLAARILTRSEVEGGCVEHLLESGRDVARLSAADRALLLELVNGVLRQRSYLDLLLRRYIARGYRKSPALLKNWLRIAVYQLVFLDRVPDYAVVSEAVEKGKRLFGAKRAKFINAVLRNYLRERYRPPQPGSDAPLAELAEYYSHPVWLVERFQQQFPDHDPVAWMHANNRTPKTTVRMLRNGGAEEEGLEPVAGFPGYFFLPHGRPVTDLDCWRKGRCIAQDPSADLALRLLAPVAGEYLIDLCAAPGGKTIVLAAAVGREGKIAAVDLAPKRLQKLRDNLRRVGMGNVLLIAADGRSVELEAADGVLLDAPCSGLGVMARRADLRWQRRPEDFEKLISLQKELLEQAARLVRPGGRIVYSTCSIDREENEGVIAEFLRRHGRYVLEPATGRIDPAFVTKEGFVRAFPHLHEVDGIFAARLKRRG